MFYQLTETPNAVMLEKPFHFKGTSSILLNPSLLSLTDNMNTPLCLKSITLLKIMK